MQEPSNDRDADLMTRMNKVLNEAGGEGGGGGKGRSWFESLIAGGERGGRGVRHRSANSSN